jgi:hypothetical protein
MTNLHKDIFGVTLGLQGLAVMGRGLELVPKFSKNGRMKTPSTKKMVKGFMDITVGTAMIGPTANLVNAL